MEHVSKVSFMAALGRYKQAGERCAAAEAAYVRNYAEALSKSEAKNEKLREADADLKTDALREARDRARVELSAAKFEVEYLLRVAGAGREPEAA